MEGMVDVVGALVAPQFLLRERSPLLSSIRPLQLPLPFVGRVSLRRGLVLVNFGRFQVEIGQLPERLLVGTDEPRVLILGLQAAHFLLGLLLLELVQQHLRILVLLQAHQVALALPGLASR